MVQSEYNPKSECVSDCLYNYDIHEEIGRGATSIVYRATCKRGRLRHRQVALKKVIVPHVETLAQADREIAHLAPSTTLHKGLHHPNIVSLLSTFSNPSCHYHALELCSQGNLAALLQSRNPPVLTENELRGLVKNLVEALIYLKNNRIIHRDIKLSNILLTHEFRIKLADFGLAIQLPSTTSTTSTFCGSPNYIAPEIVSRIPYGFAVDIWSLGSLMATCLSGVPAFEAPSVNAIFARVVSGVYTLSDTVSHEARDLISGLLQIDPADRIPLHRILSHSFFKPGLPVQSLTHTRAYSHLPSPSSGKSKEDVPVFGNENFSRYPVSLSKGSPSHKKRFSSKPRSSSGPACMTSPRKPLKDRQNRDIRSILGDELSYPHAFAGKENARRVVSAPSPNIMRDNGIRLNPMLPPSRVVSNVTTPSLTADSGSLPSGTVYEGDDYDSKLGKRTSPLIQHPLLRPPGDLGSRDLDEHRHWLSSQGADFVVSTAPPGKSALTPQTLTTNMMIPQQVQDHEIDSHRVLRPPPASGSVIPLDATRPAGLTTAYLTPKTHKLAHGQIVVLPSNSLLVDFREGERRKGREGNKVLVIAPEGQTIQIFSAPHLSTPCCLAEPLATYSLHNLPTTYWKLYNDAERVVDRLKQRIPKLVWNKVDVKCTLMANASCGDIELTFPCRDAKEQDGRQQGSNMRIRLSRVQHTLEVARYNASILGTQAGTSEWVKKVLPMPGDCLDLSMGSLDGLDSLEKAGLQHLADFLRVCETVESFDPQNSRSVEDRSPGFAPAPTPPQRSDDACDGQEFEPRQRLEEVLSRLQDKSSVPSSRGRLALRDGNIDDETLPTVATMASTNVLRSIGLPPRPSKFSRQQGPSRPGSMSGYVSGSHVSQAQKMQAGFTNETQDAPETRFIPSAGWCVRQRTKDACCYKVMFQDGASLLLEIGPAGREAVHYSTKDPGEPLLHLTKGNAEVMLPERMKALERFVRLFDDG